MTAPADVAVSTAIAASILDVAGLASERITQSAVASAGQELVSLNATAPPAVAVQTGVINVVIIIP